MKTIMGLKTNGNSCMQGLANKTTDGDCGLLANTMNDFFVSVSDHLPRLNKNHKVFDVNEELPDQVKLMLSNLEELAERPQQMFLSNWFICGIRRQIN